MFKQVSLLCSIVALLVPRFAAADKSQFDTLPNGDSPTGRYSLVWGIHGRDEIDWDKVDDRDHGREYLDKLIDEKHCVENCIMDQRTDKVVFTLRYPDNYFSGFCPREANHDRLDIAWDPSERYVAIVLQNKWGTTCAFVVDLRPGVKVTQQDILPIFDKPILAGLRSYGKTYSRLIKTGGVTRVEPYLAGAAGDLCFTIDYLVPKSDDLYFVGMSVLVVNLNGPRIAVTPGPVRERHTIETVYSGTVGKNLRVEMRLAETNTDGTVRGDAATLRGTYYYLSDRQPLALSGSGALQADYQRSYFEDPDPKRLLHLVERDHGKQTGEFIGECVHGHLKGTWTSADGKRKLPFHLVAQSINAKK